MWPNTEIAGDAEGTWELICAFFSHHLSDEVPTYLMGTSVLLIVAGIPLLIYGARISRLVVVATAALAGAAIGRQYQELFPLPPPAPALIGALMAGAAGHWLYRGCVAILSAGAMGAVACGLFATTAVLPHVQWDGSLRQEDLEIRLAPEPSSYLDPILSSLEAEAARIEKQTPGLRERAIQVVLLSGASGLLVGLLAPRFAMILWTSLGGAGLVCIGVVGIVLAAGRATWLDLGSSPTPWTLVFASLVCLGAVFQWRWGNAFGATAAARALKASTA
jgi:hypothetical protein